MVTGIDRNNQSSAQPKKIRKSTTRAQKNEMALYSNISTLIRQSSMHQQAYIDLLLSRFLIFCAIPFAVLDNIISGMYLFSCRQLYCAGSFGILCPTHISRSRCFRSWISSGDTLKPIHFSHSHLMVRVPGLKIRFTLAIPQRRRLGPFSLMGIPLKETSRADKGNPHIQRI
jgi:hypothetical protein